MLFHSSWQASSQDIIDIRFIRGWLFYQFGFIKDGNQCLIRCWIWFIGLDDDGWGYSLYARALSGRSLFTLSF